uniref:B30.2/SPRY domain-containing protein n=1 Tax=Panagrolaimus superbus TaxID=310955 RepID=A0A914Y608_9BILA
MLGKDSHGWAMYIDDKRLWFYHNHNHDIRVERGHGGNGAVIGVLMDCDQGTLSYYVNDRLIEANAHPYAFK